MANSLPLPTQSPAKASFQDLPAHPDAATSNDDSSNNSHGSTGRNGSANGAPAGPAVSAADRTAVDADVMDVESETHPNAQETAAASVPPPAPPPTLAAPAPLRPPGQGHQNRPARSPVRTPEPQTTLPSRQVANGGGGYDNARQAAAPSPSPRSPSPADSSPSTPGHIPPFDWEEFEARYERALADMEGEEAELLREFERLVNYFNVWASAASAHDDERAVKRLQTRERYVKIAEQTLSQRKQHLTEVVRAFQSALALLSQT